MASVIEDLDLCILNTGHPTHHMQTDTQSIIDFSLSSPDAYLDFSWEISKVYMAATTTPSLSPIPPSNRHLDYRVGN